MLESIFNKAAANQICNFTKIRLQYRCFPVKLVKILRKPNFEEHLPTDVSINERQQETHALLCKKNEFHLVSLSRGQ